MRAPRTTVQTEANQVDMDLYRLASRIDQLAEMASRGKPKMDRDLVIAASSVSSARAAVRKHMHPTDIAGTV
jgi:hypothetical protein